MSWNKSVLDLPEEAFVKFVDDAGRRAAKSAKDGNTFLAIQRIGMVISGIHLYELRKERNWKLLREARDRNVRLVVQALN